MPRLFTALVPPEQAVAHLSTRLERVGGIRWMSDRDWHVTLGFYGDSDDQDSRASWLRERLAGLAAPRVRLSGAGRFPGVFWIGLSSVDESDERAFKAVARAAGAGLDELAFRPHLTVARSPGRGGRVIGDLVRRYSDYSGPRWTASEVLLFQSRPGSEGPRYHVLERFALS